MRIDFGKSTILVFGLFAVVGIGMIAAAIDYNQPWHPWDQVQLPSGVWTGLNADKVDGIEGGSICQTDGTNCPAAEGGISPGSVVGGYTYAEDSSGRGTYCDSWGQAGCSGASGWGSYRGPGVCNEGTLKVPTTPEFKKILIGSSEWVTYICLSQ